MRISDWSSDVCSSDLRILLKLLFEPFEQCEGVGGCAGETGNHFAFFGTTFADAPHLACVGLHHRIAHRNLAVARDHGFAAALDADDGGAVPLEEAVV